MEKRLLELILSVALVGVVAFRFWVRRGVAVVSVHEVRRRLNARDPIVVVDVRTPAEFARGHLPGAINLPLERVAEAASFLDPQGETLLVCAKGPRSIMAYRRLRAMGFTNLRQIEGGMARWAWETTTAP